MNQIDRILVAERARLGIFCGKHHQVLNMVGGELERQLGAVREGEGDRVSVEVDRERVVAVLDELRQAYTEMGGIVKSIYAEIVAASQTEVPEGFDPGSLEGHPLETGPPEEEGLQSDE